MSEAKPKSEWTPQDWHENLSGTNPAPAFDPYENQTCRCGVPGPGQRNMCGYEASNEEIPCECPCHAAPAFDPAASLDPDISTAKGGLEYIASSPPHEHGGFHPNTVAIAKDALAEIARLQADNAALRAYIEERAEDRHLLHGGPGKGDRFWNCSWAPCKRNAEFLRGLTPQNETI